MSDPTLTANLLDAWRNAERASEAARTAAAHAVAAPAGVTLAAAEVEVTRAKEAYLERQRRQARADSATVEAAPSRAEPEPGPA